MKYILIILILFFCSNLTAQIGGFPQNPKVGSCYQRIFDLDERYEWKEVECSKIKDNSKSNPNVCTNKDIEKAREFSSKIKTYQKKLKSLGYKIVVNGNLDNRTIRAHHSYLSKRIRAERKKQKTERKKLRLLRKKEKEKEKTLSSNKN